MSVLLEKFLIKNNYTHFNKQDVSFQLLTHPDNPSFRSMTDTLDYFGIENVAASVPEEALEMLPNGFITIINGDGEELVFATKKDGYIVTENENGKKSKHSTVDFKKKWSKKIIAIDKTVKKNTFKDIGNYWFFIPLVVLIFFIIIQSPSILKLSKILLASIGLYISYLLVKEKIGYHSSAVLNVCTSLPNSNCNDVINSKGGNITKDISLADASFLYFIILFFNSIFLEDNMIISVMLFMALPIILFSLYYQGLVVKKWCMLCLGIVLVLGLLNLTLIWGINMQILYINIIELLLVISLILPAYFYAKNLIKTNKKNNEEIIASRRFKRNPEIVKNIMRDAEIVKDIDVSENEVIIGNIGGKNKIITYTNPFCGFCKSAFESYVKILAMNPEIQIIMRFNTELNDQNALTSQISCRLVEIYHETDAEVFINTYISWFKDKNIDNFLKKYGNPKFGKENLNLFEKHKSWANNNNISFTPATIINGRLFPSSYGYKDLVYVINDIFEFENDRNQTIEV
jgi:hypothetical protein